MWEEFARLKRWSSALISAGLWVAGSTIAIAQAPPVPEPSLPAAAPAESGAAAGAAPRTLSVEERFQKLEAMNLKLLEQNQKLTEQVKSLTERVAQIPPVAATVPPEVAPIIVPPVEAADTTADRAMPGSGVAGVDLMAQPTGPPPPMGDSGVPDALRVDPLANSTMIGNDLIDFDTKDTNGLKMNARWGRQDITNGLWFESANKNFQFHIGGRTQMDDSMFAAGNAVQFGPNGIGKLRDGVDVRRARIRLEGAIFENMLYVMEYDFANTSAGLGTGTPQFGVVSGADRITTVANLPAIPVAVPTDLFIGFRKLPIIGNLRIGNQKEPLGFERLQSSRFLNFMERSFNNDAFYSTFGNGFSPGISMFSFTEDLRMTWAAGVFKNITNSFNYDVGGGDYAETARMTRLLIYEDNGQELMHLGISGRNSAINGGLDRFRVRGPERAGESAGWPTYANTGIFAGSGGQQDINLESVNVFGPWTIDGEYDFHFTNNAFQGSHQPGVGTVLYSGGYVEVLYFLTGEYRHYLREAGVFDRIVPKRNAFWVKGKDGKPNEKGPGAWQLGLRYNYLNLNDKGIEGGVLNDITLGLNWFINPNSKFQWNYSVTNRRSPGSPGVAGGQSDGTIQGFGMRYALDY